MPKYVKLWIICILILQHHTPDLLTLHFLFFLNTEINKITLKTTGKIVKAGVYEFSGSVTLKMSDYGMKRPTAMLGLMKVGDAITLKYDVTFEGAPIN